MKKLIIFLMVPAVALAFISCKKLKASDLIGKNFCGQYKGWEICMKFDSDSEGKKSLTRGNVTNTFDFSYHIAGKLIKFSSEPVLVEKDLRYKNGKLVGSGFTFHIDNDMTMNVVLSSADEKKTEEKKPETTPEKKDVKK
jgi:hypothetical protein